jgi:HEAT repeat protein
MKTSISKKIKCIFGLNLAVFFLVAGSQCKADNPDQIISDFSSTLSLVRQYDYGKSHAWLEDFQNIMVSVYNNPQTHDQVESMMIDALNTKISLASKQMICSFLTPIATAKSIPVLKEMLTDDQLSASALSVMQMIPDPAVDQILVKALSVTNGLTKVGIVNVIAIRKDKSTVKALSKLIFDEDIILAKASISALGKIGDDLAIKSLQEAFGKSNDQLKFEISDALLLCAANISDSEKEKALSIYLEVFHEKLSPSIQFAALQGVLRCDYKRGESLIIDMLSSNDPESQTLVMPIVRDLNRDTDIAVILEILPELGEYQQMQLFSTIADRKDRSIVQVVKEAVYHDNPDIQLAALMAFRNIGTAEDVEFIAKAASQKRGRQRDMARECLIVLKGKDVDLEIISGLQNPEPKIRIEFIRSIGERNQIAGVDPVMKTLNDPDRKVRLESYKVLGKLAGPEKLNEIIHFSLNAKTSAERIEAERTITLVSLKIQDKDQQVEAILTILPDVEEKASIVMLVQALGNIGNEKALPVIRDYLNHDETEIQIAAVKALSVWPDATPLKDLKRIVESSDDIKMHNLAMRGYITMIQIDEQMTEDSKSEECKYALDLARNLDEQRMVVSGLSVIRSTKALEMAVDLLKDPDLKSEAEAAIASMAGRIGNIDPVYTKSVLNELIETTDNEQFKARLTEILKWID